MIDVKKMVMISLEKATKLKIQGGLPPNDEAYLEGKLDLGQDVLRWLLSNEREEQDMVKNELVSKRVRLSDIQPKQRESKLGTMIQEIASDLRPEEAELINKDKIQWGNFSAKVAKMRNRGLLPNYITSKKSGTDFYLVRLAEGEVVKTRNREKPSQR